MNIEKGSIITLAIGALVALLLIGIGIYQICKKTPVAFYTGEMPPVANKLKSVSAWNKGHGFLWIGYGLIIIACFVTAVFSTADSLIKALILFGGIILPAALLVAGHHLLIKKLLL